MSAPRVLVLRTAGTNCDQETKYAAERTGAMVDLIHLNRLVETRIALHAYHALILPGGFSYGDDIAAGRILATEIRYRLGTELLRFVDEGKLVLGICNGFQALVKMGLLPGTQLLAAVPDTKRKRKTARLVRVEAEPGKKDFEEGGPSPVVPMPPPASQDFTITHNDSGKFEDRWVRLQACSRICEFVKEGDLFYLPVAHGEGKFIARTAAALEALEGSGQVVLRYVGPEHNPNGSVNGIAGVCDPTGRVFGLMPHPERHIDPTQHPRWTREGIRDHPDGLVIFENAVRYMKKNLL
jgi:phosphoribosylformylglycinamidine synthase